MVVHFCSEFWGSVHYHLWVNVRPCLGHLFVPLAQSCSGLMALACSIGVESLLYNNTFIIIVIIIIIIIIQRGRSMDAFIFRSKHHRAGNFEACCQWVVHNMQISTQLFTFYGTKVRLSIGSSWTEKFASTGE